MNEALSRQLDMLKTTLSQTLINLLEDPSVLEIMLNPDGALMIETQDGQKKPTEHQLSLAERQNIMNLLATLNQTEIHTNQPLLAVPLLLYPARFQGMIPPIVAAPSFAIRKHTARKITLQDYIDTGCLTQKQAETLRQSLLNRENIIIAGGASSGKTTFANALMQELAQTEDRILLLEDLPELSCAAQDHVRLLTSKSVSMRELVKTALRLRPDRIMVGEVRDGTALDLLKAWNTGHPGGLCTLHANTAESVHSRLIDLVGEASAHIPDHLIKEAVHRIIFMQRMPDGSRKIKTLI